ncbi:MAG TPA: hypothetical protein VKF59_04675 [Candidatus Dormibacteraeota bacterium]|nr:hypothetical protein [Candidatus Dormibacteraeota bacterium]
MAEDLTALAPDEIEARLLDVRARMRPVEERLAELRAERDVLLTERRRRERLAHRERRADLREAVRAGDLPTFERLVAEAGSGSFDDYRYHLKTGGEVRLGFPGARPAVAFTDGRRVTQARDLGQAAELYAAGWEVGSPGRPGLRVHFPGTRQERLVDPEDVHIRPADVG